MNDRFRFRFWNKTRKIMETFNNSPLTLGGLLLGKNDDYEINQCTGLKDKNGKLIYEGDILKDKYGALHPISWNDKGFYEADTFAVAGFYNAIQEDMEVIGNIYENPELLRRVNDE